MTYPVFATGDVLNASDMNAVGMWLVKTQTVGTAVSSVTVSDAFSANYQNYRIVYMGGSASADGDIRMTLGAAATGYYMALPYSNYAAGTAAAATNNGASWQFAGSSRTSICSLTVDLFGPQTTDETVITGIYVGAKNGSVAGAFGGFLDNTTAYTAFTLTPSAGTITGGTIRVYGYRN